MTTEHSKPVESGERAELINCPDCGGQGYDADVTTDRVFKDTCQRCNGKGAVETSDENVRDEGCAFGRREDHEYPGESGDAYLAGFKRAATLLAADDKAGGEVVWTLVTERMPPPDSWLLVMWGDHKAVDKAHTFTKWKHKKHPLGYLIQGHPGAHVDVTHWMLLPAPDATRPQPQADQPAERVALTSEQKHILFSCIGIHESWGDLEYYLQGIEDAERAHGITGKDQS